MYKYKKIRDKTRKEDEIMSEFWKKEEPEIFESGRLRLQLYKTAGKLQIRRYSKYGTFGAVTIDRRAITPDMIEILKKFINLCEERKGE